MRSWSDFWSWVEGFTNVICSHPSCFLSLLRVCHVLFTLSYIEVILVDYESVEVIQLFPTCYLLMILWFSIRVLYEKFGTYSIFWEFMSTCQNRLLITKNWVLHSVQTHILSFEKRFNRVWVFYASLVLINTLGFLIFLVGLREHNLIIFWIAFMQKYNNDHVNFSLWLEMKYSWS